MQESQKDQNSLKDKIYHSNLYENVFKTHIYCLKKALKIAQKYKKKSLIKVCDQLLSDLYKKQGKEKK